MTVDAQVGAWFLARSQAHPELVDASRVLALGLHPWVFRVLVVVVVLRAWRAGRRRSALVVAAAMAGGGALGGVLKLVVQRPRPAWEEPLATATGYSMPSGHALNATLGCALLVMLAWPSLSGGARAAALALATAVAALGAVHRLVLGVHYLTDVVAGVVLGLVVVGAAVAGERRLAPGGFRARRGEAAGSR